jgi:segregation and condensation protein B
VSLNSNFPEGRPSLTECLESLLVISSEPVSVEEFSCSLGYSEKEIMEALLALQDHYETGHGFRLVRIGGGWQLASAPELSELVSRFREDVQNQPLRLSRAALETLAVVAYKQPVTRAEIEEIRGVRSDKVVETLLRLGLIRIAGRRKGTGTPLLFRTTANFLDAFNLDSISDLPSLQDLEDNLDKESDASLQEENR